MGYTEQEKVEEFKNIRDFLDSVEIAAEVLEKGMGVETATLLISLPSKEELPEDEELTEDQLHIATGYLLDLDDSEDKVAKYLLFYSQIRVDLSAMKTEEVLVMLNELNRKVRVGHYFIGRLEENGPLTVQYRATVTGPADAPFDEGVVADTILEMGVGYDVAKGALMMANEDCKNRG